MEWIMKAVADLEAQLYATAERLREKYDEVEIRHLEDGGYAVYVR